MTAEEIGKFLEENEKKEDNSVNSNINQQSQSERTSNKNDRGSKFLGLSLLSTILISLVVLVIKFIR